MPLRHVLLALAIALVLGLSFVAIHVGLEEAPPLLLTALRYAMAALPAMFFVRRPAVDWRLLVAYGLCIGVGQFGLLFVAIALGMPAGLASLVVQLQVFFTILLAFIVLGERPQLWQVVGALVAFAGIGVISLERLDGAALLPLLLTIAAAGFWGLGNLASKRAGRIDMLGLVVWSALVPPLPLLLGSIALEGLEANLAALSQLSWRGIGSVAFMAWGATLFGFTMWARLLSLYPASQVTPFALCIPIAGIASAALLLGEQVSGLEIAGGLFVFAGLLVNIFGARFVGRLRRGMT
jgi:O-acetylserine/cysteine efflux transporter